MSLVRDIPFPMVALEETILVTCSAIYLETTAAYTTGIVGLRGSKTTVSALVSTGDIGNLTTNAGTKLVSSGGMAVGTTQGIIIDRLRFPVGAARYTAAVVSAHLVSTRGSTEADRKLAIGVKLQHGDSSGGGDMADYSTASQPDDRIYFGSSVRTTDMANWDVTESSGPFYGVSNPGYYDLRGAKRYVRAVVRAGLDGVTTSQANEEGCRVGATICFLSGDSLPQRADTTGPYSSTTST